MWGSTLNPPFINRFLEEKCGSAKYRTHYPQRKVTGNCGKNEGVREQIPDDKSNLKGAQKEK